MGTPYLGELKWVAFNFAPKGWALANGQLLPINQNQALFSLLGTTYGGNGQTNFALPNVQGRAPLHMGNTFLLGQVGGETAHTLSASEMPAHNHFLNVSTANGTTADPTGAYFSGTGGPNLYAAVNSVTTTNPATVANVGGSQPHDNMQPYLVLNCIVALQGVFPSRA